MIWVVMNNYAYGTIAGLEMAHYGTTFGSVFRKDGEPYSPDFAAIARAYGAEGVTDQVGRRVQAGSRARRRVGKPFVIDVAMHERAGADGGHWNINDIYSPGRKVDHVAIP